MVHGEVDGQGWSAHSCQVARPDDPMVAVGGHSLGQGKANQYQYRGQRPPHYPQPGMPLSDVVQESGGDDITVGDPGGNYREGGVVPVPLVGVALGEENRAGLGGQPI